MSKNLEFCLDLFKTTSVVESNLTKLKIIKMLQCSRFINCALHEVTLNLILGNLSLSSEQKKELRPLKKFIYKLSKKSTSKKQVTPQMLNSYIKYIKILLPSLKEVISLK